MKITHVQLKNIRSFRKKADFDLNLGLNILVGPNGGGKSILLEILNNFILLLIPKYQFDNSNGLRFRPTEINSTNFGRVFSPHFDDLKTKSEFKVTLTLTEHDKELFQKCLEFINVIYGDIEIIVSGVNGLGALKTQFLDPYKTYCEFLLKDNLDPFIIRLEFENGVKILRSGSQRELVLIDFLNKYEKFRMILWYYKIAKGRVDDMSLPELLTYISPNRSVGHISNFKLNFDTREQAITSNRKNQISQNSVNQSVQDSSIDYISPFIQDIAETIFRGLNTFDPPITQKKSLENHEHYQNFNQLLNKYLHIKLEIKQDRVSPLNFKVSLIKNKKNRDLQYLSSGQKQIIYHIAYLSDPLLQGGTILIDEPEVHLHPQLQKKLLKLLTEASMQNSIQIINATHSELFMNEDTFETVTRVYYHDNSSKLVQATREKSVNFKDVIQIINANNNEKVYFSDEVILVEGDIDRLVLQAILEYLTDKHHIERSIEVVAVYGKHNFNKYRAMLNSMGIKNSIISDFDYIYTVAPPEIRQLFELNMERIAEAIEDGLSDKSKDGKWLVKSLDVAIKTGNMDELKECWKYIESRNKKVKENYSHEEKESLRKFIIAQKSKDIHHLYKNGLTGVKGDIESYLPFEYRGKNFNLIVPWIKSTEFIGQVSESKNGEELISTIKEVLGISIIE